MIRPKWIVVHECDLDDGTPTCWALEFAKTNITLLTQCLMGHTMSRLMTVSRLQRLAHC